MLHPKKFYRDFDYLLNRITKKQTGKNFLCSILNEFVLNFGADLHINSWRVYEKRGSDYVLVSPIEAKAKTGRNQPIPVESVGVQLVLKNGSYIYHENPASIDPEIAHRDYYAIPVAFTLSSEHRWLVLFELTDGWDREEVIFVLNAIRTALNYRLFSEVVQSALEQAEQIQRSLLPGENPTFPGYEIAGRSLPAELVGGDLFDYFEFDGDIIGLCIGDASGHGLPAALLVRDVVTGLRMGLEKQLKMGHTLEKLNKVIYRSTLSSRFVSLFYGELEKNGQLIYVNAGHPAPLLIHKEQVQKLKATGLILGAVPEITLNRAYVQMEPDSVLVMYTDGLFERENREEVDYSIGRIKRLVVEHQDKSAQEILDLLFEDAFEYGGRTNWEDDSTLVVIKRTRK